METAKACHPDRVLSSCVALGPSVIYLLWTLIFSSEDGILTLEIFARFYLDNVSKRFLTMTGMY